MAGLFKSVGSAIGGLFGGQQTPQPIVIPAAPDPAPTIDQAAKAREAEDIMRRRKGRAATILTGAQGAGTPTTATKALLGE